MARTRGGLGCLTSPLRGKPSGGNARRSSAACICCIGPHHRPSGADGSVRTPLTGCCGSTGGEVRAARTPRTPKTPCTPTARRLCGVRSFSRTTPRGRRGQVRSFPAPPAAAVVAAAPSVGAATAARTPRTPSTPIGRSQRSTCCVGPAQGGSAKLGARRRWLSSARQAVAKTPRRAASRAMGAVRAGSSSGDVVKVYNTRLAEAEQEAVTVTVKEEASSICSNDEYARLCREGFAPREDVAAVTIQAYFRGHLARRAFKALRSLVRLQAVARGAYVRRQAEVAVHCMQATVRLQMRVRAKKMLTAKPKDKEGQLLLQS